MMFYNNESTHIVPQNTLQTGSQATNRSALRKLLIAQRHAMTAPERRRSTDSVLASLVHTLQTQHPMATVALYLPHAGELDITALAQQISNPMCLPVVVGAAQALQFAQWRAGDPLSTDAYGIAVPTNKTWLTPDVLLIPCVGFTLQRYRLGYGAGFYDRTIAALRAAGASPLATGIAWQHAACHFEAGDHDVTMDSMLVA
jgi:5-formyltetrahydrofolate cyclo-ligase